MKTPTEEEFLDTIFSSIKKNDVLNKPRTTSRVSAVTDNNRIYYQVGTNDEKFVSCDEFKKVYDILLKKHKITSLELSNIVPNSKPCNKTTIECILLDLNLVKKDTDKSLLRLF